MADPTAATATTPLHHARRPACARRPSWRGTNHRGPLRAPGFCETSDVGPWVGRALVVAAVFLITATGCQTPYESGRMAYVGGRFDQAAQHARKGLADHPDDPANNLLLARTLVAQQNYRDALPYALKAMQSAQFTAQAGRVLGKIHWELDRPIDAAAAWKKARQADAASVGDTDYRRALSAAVQEAMRSQTFGRALELRQELADQDADNQLVTANKFRVNREKLAADLMHDGQSSQAAAIYERLATDHPDRPSYELAVGNLQLRLDNPDKAIEAYTRYVDSYEGAERIDRMQQIASGSQRANADGVAIHFYRAAIDATGDAVSFRRAKTHLIVADLLFEASDVDGAKQQIDQYMADMRTLRDGQLSPDVYMTVAAQATTHHQGDYAIELLEAGLEGSPPRWALTKKLADLYARRARGADVERVLKRYVTRTAPDDPAADSAQRARNNAALWAYNRRNYALARLFGERSTEYGSVDGQTWRLLAQTYAKLGQRDKFKIALEHYASKVAGNRARMLQVADMYTDQRLYDEAEAIYERIIKDDPSSLALVDQLAGLYRTWDKPGRVETTYDRWIRANGAHPEQYQLVGERLVRRGEPNRGLPYLRKAAPKKPADDGSPRVWLEIADIHADQHRDIDMKHALDNFLATTTSSKRSALRSVLSRYRSANMSAETVDVLQTLVELDSDELSYYQQLSQAYFNQGRQQDAVALWSDYLDRSPHPFETLQAVNQWFERRRQPQWLLAIYQHLLARDDPDPRIYRLVANTYMSLADRNAVVTVRGTMPTSGLPEHPMEQARNYFRLYLNQADPPEAELLAIAESLGHHDMWQLAADILAKLVDGEADGSKRRFQWANALLHTGRVDRAKTVLAAFHKARGANSEDTYEIALALFSTHHYKAAARYYRELLDADKPNYVLSAFRQLATIYRQWGRPEDIPDLIDAYLERAQTPAKARQKVLETLQNAGLYGQAADQIERIRSFQGDVMETELAKNLFRAGKLDDAKTVFRRFASDNSYPGDAWVLVGQFYAAHGQPKLAKNAYDQAVKAAPDNGHTHRAQGLYLLAHGEVDAGQKALALARESSAEGQRQKIIARQVQALIDIGRPKLARDTAEAASPSAAGGPGELMSVVANYDLATQPAQQATRRAQRVAKSSMPLATRASLLARHGFRRQAADLLGKEIANGDYYSASQVLGRNNDLVTTLGGFDELEAIFDPLFNQPDEGSRIRAQLGEYFVSQGAYERGIAHLRSAIAHGHTEFRQTLAQAYDALGYHQEALRVYQHVLDGASRDNLGSILRNIGMRYEAQGHPQRFLRLLSALVSDRRYTAAAAPLLAESLAERGRVRQVSDLLADTTSVDGGRDQALPEQALPEQPSRQRSSRQRPSGVASAQLLGSPGAGSQLAASMLGAVAGEGYRAETRHMVDRLASTGADTDSLQALSLRLAAADSKERAAHQARQMVAELGLSTPDNTRRLQIAKVLRRHGRYDLAADIAGVGLDSADQGIQSDTTRFLLANAMADDDTDRIAALSEHYLEASDDKIQAQSDLADWLSRLGLDERALAHARSVARTLPTKQHVFNALRLAIIAGDVDAVDAMAERLLRVAKNPIELIDSLLQRTQQRADVVGPLLAITAAARPAALDTKLTNIELLCRRGQVDQARDQIGALLAFAGDDALAVETIIERLYEAGLFVEVGRYIAPKLDGVDWTRKTHRLVGLSLWELGRTEQAGSHLDAYVDASPDPALALTKCAQLLAESDFVDAAGDYASRAISRKPERPEPYYFRGLDRIQNGDLQAGLEDIDRGVGPGVNRGYGLYYAALCALKAGHVDAATTLARQLADSTDPGQPGLPLRLAMDVFREADRPEKGVGFLETNFPAVAAGTGILGEELVAQTSGLYEAAGNDQRAHQLYESALGDLLISEPSGSTAIVYMNNLAYTYATTNAKLERGFELVRRAIAAGSTRNPSYLDTLGWLYFRRGDLQLAETYVRRSLRSATGSDSGTAELLDHLIAIEQANGQMQTATWNQIYRRHLD